MADSCGDNRFVLIERAKKNFIENTNISDEELAVLDNMCFRMWQLGLLKKYNKIDEDKLDELADTANPNNPKGDTYEVGQYFGFKDGFVVGYRKALESN